jgi:hypothetical protein
MDQGGQLEGRIPGATQTVEIERFGRTARFAILDPEEYIRSHHLAGRFWEGHMLLFAAQPAVRGPIEKSTGRELSVQLAPTTRGDPSGSRSENTPTWPCPQEHVQVGCWELGSETD